MVLACKSPSFIASIPHLSSGITNHHIIFGNLYVFCSILKEWLHPQYDENKLSQASMQDMQAGIGWHGLFVFEVSSFLLFVAQRPRTAMQPLVLQQPQYCCQPPPWTQAFGAFSASQIHQLWKLLFFLLCFLGFAWQVGKQSLKGVDSQNKNKVIRKLNAHVPASLTFP